jgi:hypothetical protein
LLKNFDSTKARITYSLHITIFSSTAKIYFLAEDPENVELDAYACI